MHGIGTPCITAPSTFSLFTSVLDDINFEICKASQHSLKLQYNTKTTTLKR